MTLTLSGSRLRVQVGPRINYGQMAPGWAWQFIGEYPNEVYNLRYPTETQALYEPGLKAWHLTPANGQQWQIDVAMDPAQWTFPVGSFTTVTPPGQQACMAPVNSSIANALSSADNWLSGKPFLLYVQRDLLTPADTAWTFCWGAGWTLTWSRENNPLVTGPDGFNYPCKARDVNAREYQRSAEMSWAFWYQDGDLHLTGSALRTAWVIPNIGVIPDAPCTFAASGGGFAMACAPFSFQGSGSILTAFIDTGQALTLETPFTYRSYGTVPAGCTAAVTLAQVSGTTAQFLLTLTGDGSNTPLIGKFEVILLPTFDEPAQQWTDISAWPISGMMSLYKTFSANICVLDIVYREVIDGQNLITLLGGLTGEWAVAIDIAYLMMDSASSALAAPTWFRRFSGFTARREETGGASDDNSHPAKLRLTIVNRYMQFQGALGRCPCLQGYRVDQALQLIALFGGVKPEDIVIPAAIPSVLSDPGKRYDQSIWQPQPGDSADTWIQQICKRFPNVRAEFGMDGKFYIFQSTYSAQSPVVTLSTEPGIDPLYALDVVTSLSDSNGMCNMVTVEGRTPEGNPLYATVSDSNSITNPLADNYVGRVIQRWVKDDSLTEQTDVDNAAQAEFNRRRSGHRLIELTRQQWAGWLLVPGTLITVRDFTTDIGVCDALVEELHLRLEPDIITPTKIVANTYIP